MVNETWLDKTISWVDPIAGAKRLYARQMTEVARIQLRGFDGAETGRRTKNWRTDSGSVNTETKVTLATLRNRSRDLIRNEPYARRAGQVIVGNTVGAGIIAKAIAKTEGRSKKFQDAWNDWADSVDCDYDGRNNFYGLQALAMQTIFESGEVLIRRIKKDSKFELSVPMQLQVLEPDFLDTRKEERTETTFTIQGVQFNNQGKRIGYWLFDAHPGDQGIFPYKTIQSQLVSADDVVHVFKSERAGQVRGIPWLAPVIVKLKDLSDYSDFTLMRQKVSACFTAFVTTPDPMDLTTGVSAPVIGEKLEPGMTEQLGQGQSVEFANPPGAADFTPFSNGQLRSIASGLGVSFEALTNDYSNVNFSSGRLGWIEFSRNVDVWRWHLLIPHFNVPSWRWFTEAAVHVGFGTEKVLSRWTPPRREMIDPAKEVEGLKNQVRGGFMSLSEGIRQNGYEPKEVLTEIAEDNKLIDKLGLTLDTDPRADLNPASTAPKNPTDQVPKNDA